MPQISSFPTVGVSGHLRCWLIIAAVLSASCQRAEFEGPTGSLRGGVELPDGIEGDGLMVQFRHQLTGHTFAAEVDEDGRFHISFGPNRDSRIPVGRYLYSLAASIEDSPMTPEEQTRALLDPPSGSASPRDLDRTELFRRYGVFEESRSIEVNEGDNDVEILIPRFDNAE